MPIGNYPLGYGNPVGDALGAATQAFQLGTAIRRQPEIEQQQREDREYAKKVQQANIDQLNRQGQLTDYELVDYQRKLATDQSSKRLADVASQVKTGMIKPEEAVPLLGKALVDADIPLYAGSDQYRQDMKTAVQSSQTGNVNDPSAKDAFNRLHFTSINSGVGTIGKDGEPIIEKRLTQLGAGQNPNGQPGLFAGVYNFTGDNSGYPSYVTKGRIPGAPAAPVNIEAWAQHLGGMDQISDQLQSDPRLKSVMDQLHALSPDQQKDFMLGVIRSRAAAAEGKLQESEDLVQATSHAAIIRDNTIGKLHVLPLANELDPSQIALNFARANRLEQAPTAKPVLMTDDKGNQYWGHQGDTILPGHHVISAAGGSGSPADTSDISSIGAQVATGQPLNQVVPGFGKDTAAKRTQARTEAIRQIKEQNPGMTDAAAGEELANRSVDFAAGKHSSQQLTTMLGATKTAVDQLDFNADKATEEMKKLGSSDLSPVINAIARGEEKWTGNPAYSSLYFYMHAAALESARIQSGGQASVAQLNQGAAEEAKKWANVNMTPASWEAVKTAMKAEGQNRIQNYQKAVSGNRSNRSGSSASSSNVPSGIPAGSTLIGHTPDGKEVWQGPDGKKRVP